MGLRLQEKDPISNCRLHATGIYVDCVADCSASQSASSVVELLQLQFLLASSLAFSKPCLMSKTDLGIGKERPSIARSGYSRCMMLYAKRA